MKRKLSRRKFVETAAMAAISVPAVSVASAQQPGKRPAEKSAAKAAPAAPAKAGPARLPSIADYATIEAHTAGEPVYAFGFTYVYSVSPDLQPGLRVQQGNNRSWKKIHPKKSWEIKSNRFGSTPAREPKTAWNDDQPLLSVHLIDGDPATAWCSHGMTQPTVEPQWIRIDLAIESTVKSVALVPHPTGMQGSLGVPVGQAFPKQLEIRVSRDAWHWETVYKNYNFAPTDRSKPQEFSFDPRPVKQIWVLGEDFPTFVQNFGYCFSLGKVEVRDEAGQNLALVSRGAGVTVSSTEKGYGMDRFTQDMLWPIQYDVGFKYLRVGYDMGMFIWAYVEREKGKFQVDARADVVISEAVRNGINVIMCLDKGNWLYAPNPKKKDRTRELMETYYDRPPEPTQGDAAYLQGYLNYVRFMANHFKGRVRYYEVMNEWYKRPVEEYIPLLKAVIPIIREEDPGAKIMNASPGGFDRVFLTNLLKAGLGPMLDAIGWHPFSQHDPIAPGVRDYPNTVRDFRKVCESHGFRGDFLATEFNWSAPYPPPGDHVFGSQPMILSEMQKAKYALATNIRHAGLNVTSVWCETFQTQYPWAIGLVRTTFDDDPLLTTQPEPIYYALRSLCTSFAEMEPAQIAVNYEPKGQYESWTFERSDGEDKLLAFWRWGRAKDIDEPSPVDIIIQDRIITSAVGIDLLNGREQELQITPQGSNSVLKGMLLHDFPVLVRFTY